MLVPPGAPYHRGVWITVLSVSVAFVAALVIPIVVTSAVRRGDRRRGKSWPVADAETGVLFTVRPRRWQRVLIRTIGVLSIVVGGLFSLVSLVSLADPDDALPVGAVVSAIAILFGGVAFVLLASGMTRTRIEALPDRVRVRSGFRAEREVLLDDVASYSPLKNSYGGVIAKDADGARLFAANGLAQGYDHLVDHLERRTPATWAKSGLASTSR